MSQDIAVLAQVLRDLPERDGLLKIVEGMAFVMDPTADVF